MSHLKIINTSQGYIHKYLHYIPYGGGEKCAQGSGGET